MNKEFNAGSIFDIMLEESCFIAPTSDRTKVFDCKETRVKVGLSFFNYIRSTVDRDTLTVTNYTVEDHLLHPGKVARRVLERDDAVYVQTEGQGSGMLPRMNEFFAPLVWQKVDFRLLVRVQTPTFYRINAAIGMM